MANPNTNRLQPPATRNWSELVLQVLGSSPVNVVLFSCAGAFFAGHLGLLAKLEPLLVDPKLSGLLLMAVGAYLVWTLLVGTVVSARAGEMLGSQWASIWFPVKTALLAAAMVPLNHGSSLLAHSMLWAARLGAGG